MIADRDPYATKWQALGSLVIALGLVSGVYTLSSSIGWSERNPAVRHIGTALIYAAIRIRFVLTFLRIMQNGRTLLYHNGDCTQK